MAEDNVSDEAMNEYNKESLVGIVGATIFHCFSPSNCIAEALKSEEN